MMIKNYIRGHDMFGHRVSLNFNKNGDSFKTGCGGIFSIIIKLILLFYAILRLKALFLRENNQYGKNEGVPTMYETIGEDDKPEFFFNSTDVNPFMQALHTASL